MSTTQAPKQKVAATGMPSATSQDRRPAPAKIGPESAFGAAVNRREALGAGGMLALQAAAGNRAVVGLVQARRERSGTEDSAAQGIAGGGGPLPHAGTIQRLFAERAVPGGSGQPLSVPLRDKFARSLATSVDHVRIHTDSASAGAARAIGARAYAMGPNIHFAAGAYDPSSPTGEHLLAHEVAHTVQQGGDSATLQPKLETSEPGEGAELRAEAAADAMVAGRSAPAVGSARAGVIHRAAIQTNGGAFEASQYESANRASPMPLVGGNMTLSFTPNGLVTTNKHGIALIQMVDSRKDGAVNHPNNRDDYDEIALGANDRGRAGSHIDVPTAQDGKALSTNPSYAGRSKPGDQRIDDSETHPSIGQHGHRIVNGHDIELQPAVLHDEPRILSAKQQTSYFYFEVAALVTNGPLAGSYLGSVKYGFRKAQNAPAKRDPEQLELVSRGAPSAELIAAATKWNTATIKEQPTIPLPIPELQPHTDDYDGQSVHELGERIAQLQGKQDPSSLVELRAVQAALARKTDQAQAVAGPTDRRLREAQRAVLAARKRDVVEPTQGRNFVLEAVQTSAPELAEAFGGLDEMRERVADALHDLGGEGARRAGRLRKGGFISVASLLPVIADYFSLTIEILDEAGRLRTVGNGGTKALIVEIATGPRILGTEPA
jgi:hypothetical protein